MKDTLKKSDKPSHLDKSNEETNLNEKILSFNEVHELIKIINNTLSQKQIDEIIEELGIKKQQTIKLDNLLSKSKEKRKSSKFADFYGSILNYFITPSERISQILEESRNKLAEFKENKLVEDLEWVIKIINSDDLYNLNLDTILKEENLLMNSKEKNLDIESTMNFISEYSKDNFNKNKIKDISEARRASNRRMNLNFKRSITSLEVEKCPPSNQNINNEKNKRISIDHALMDKFGISNNLLKKFDKITEDECEEDKISAFQKQFSKRMSEKMDEVNLCIQLLENEKQNEKEKNDDEDDYSHEEQNNFEGNDNSNLEDDCLLNEIPIQVEHPSKSSLIDKIEDNDFNIFDFSQEVGRINILKEISNAVFLKHNLFFLINQERFVTFLDKIRVGYDYLLPYHNDIHAADVLQTCYLFYKYCNLTKEIDMTSLDLAAYFIAAIIHDYRHPGLTNNYHINKRTPISIKYNDVSVLENFHVSSAFKIISHRNSNIFCDMSVEEYRVVRKRIVECVLATDMAKHTKSQISLKIKVDRLTKTSNENILSRFITDACEDSIFERQQEILNFFIHCADISNPAKKFNVVKKWTNLVIEEFFLQGDLEKKENLPVSFLCDRNTTNVPKSQILFISNIVLPSFKILAQFSNNFDYMIKNMYDNLEQWKKEDSQNSVGTK